MGIECSRDDPISEDRRGIGGGVVCFAEVSSIKRERKVQGVSDAAIIALVLIGVRKLGTSGIGCKRTIS